MTTKRKGFTLIELLIVVAIITILASAAIVAINPGKHFKQTRNATRWSHMNSVANGVYSYIIDQGGSYPDCFYDVGGNPIVYNEAGGSPWLLVDITTCIQLIPEYISELKRQPQEWVNFLNALSINVSEFFRDPEVFQYFKEYCIPEIIKKKKQNCERVIRCWSCGCSYGEEAYSLAMLFAESLQRESEEFLIKVRATDIEGKAIEKAKNGEYQKASLGKVDKRILKKYFSSLSSDEFKVNDQVKKLVTFQKQNINMDGFFNNMDVIFFRNVKIYFSEAESEKILSKLANSLRSGGYLVLGKVETIQSSIKDLFRTININNKIFTIR